MSNCFNTNFLQYTPAHTHTHFFKKRLDLRKKEMCLKKKRVTFNGCCSYSAALRSEPRRHMFKVHSIHPSLTVNLNKPQTLRAMKKDASTACSLVCQCLHRQATARFKGSANNHDCSTEPHHTVATWFICRWGMLMELKQHCIIHLRLCSSL